MNLEISERVSDGVKIMELAGVITLGESSNTLRGRLKSAIENGDGQLVLDMAKVRYVDSAGLGALVASCTTARTGGGVIKLARPNRQFREQLQTTRLLTVFDVYDSVEDALRAFSQPA